MGIDGTSSQALDDDTAAPAAGDGDDNGTSPERVFGQQASPVDDRGYQRAETLTREQYADAVRADSSPIRPDSPGVLQSPAGRESDGWDDTERADPTADSDRAWSCGGGRGDDHAEPTAAEPLTREEYADSIRGDDSPIPQDSGQERAEGDDQPYAQFSVVEAVEAERTLGDTTPTGIGLKPTGEQLLGMKGDEPFRSRLDRLFDDAFEHADDVSDAAGHISDAIESDLNRAPGPAGHPRSYHATTVAAHDQPPPQGAGVSDAVGSIIVVSVAAVVAVRHALSELRKRA